MRRSARIVLCLGAAALIALAGGAALLVSQTTVGPAAIQSAVTRTEGMIARAWQLPAASAFQGEVIWQSNASMCGPASVANALRSLGESAISESAVLAGTGRCWTGICMLGLTLDELASLARTKTNRNVTVLRDLTPAEFLLHLRRSNETGRRYIINFNRKEIFGAGSGHHAPIGGYLEAEDLVFVLDVNRDYRPWLVERARLFAAMDTQDGARKRGMLLIE